MKILVIAPHPDDEVLGCGGTIVKKVSQGDEVYLCIVTKAYTPDWPKDYIEKRPKEIRKSNEILGIKKTHLLGYPTVKLDMLSQKELNESILNIINEVQPEIVYIPHQGDLNKDHRIVYEASLVALRPKEKIIKKILSYEILSETEWGTGFNSFIPNLYEDISKTFKIKIEAMKAYNSELRQYPHPRSLKGIEILARKRGLEIGVEYGEAFKIIREFSI